MTKSKLTKITIPRLKSKIRVGCCPKERIKPRLVFFDITFSYDAAKAIAADELQFAVDYAALCSTILSEVEHQEFHLIETLGSTVLRIILDHPLIKKAKITVTKPKAFPQADAAIVSLKAGKDKK